MSKPFRPMLAADISEDLEKLRYPVYVTPKLDGVRALVFPDGVYSRSMKKIPNRAVQEAFGRPELVGLDGELIVGSPTANDVYRKTQSVVATIDDETPVTFYVFDKYDEEACTYQHRAAALTDMIDELLIEESQDEEPLDDVLCVVDTQVAANEKELQEIEEEYLDMGYEGCIIRSFDHVYKNGRSTIREQGMLKLKRFVDGEAEIIGIEEEMHNGNAAMTNELGRTARSSHAAGLVGKGRMGALVVRDAVTGVEFKVGSGFTAEDRKTIWDRAEQYIGKQIRYRHFAIGAKDKPRFPTFSGMREGWDL